MTLARLLFELGVLKRIQRTGWLLIGEREGDSVAAHSFRAAIIAYALAKEEGVDPYKAAFAALIHDIGEARIGDLHRVAQRYVERKEEKAVEEAVEGTGLEEMAALVREIKERKGKLAEVVKNADALEMALQAKEYMAKGNALAKEWWESALRSLTLESAKRLAKAIEKEGVAWWKNV